MILTRRRILASVLVAGLGAAAPAFAQFVSTGDRLKALLEGNWQSCREPDGKYSERVYDNAVPGIGPFELHLGPYIASRPRRPAQPPEPI
jgi:hypothetical protein